MDKEAGGLRDSIPSGLVYVNTAHSCGEHRRTQCSPASEACAQGSAVLPLHCHTGVIQRQALHCRRQRIKVCVAHRIQACSATEARSALWQVVRR